VVHPPKPDIQTDPDHEFGATSYRGSDGKDDDCAYIEIEAEAPGS
jgi:hypothetical protein